MIANKHIIPGTLYAALAAAQPEANIVIRTKGTRVEIDGVDETTAQAILDAHNPVLITANKTAVANDGQDSVTVTFTAPYLAIGATITPTVEGQAVSAQTLDSDKQATLSIVAADLADGDTIEVGVQTYPHEALVIEVTA